MYVIGKVPAEAVGMTELNYCQLQCSRINFNKEFCVVALRITANQCFNLYSSPIISHGHRGDLVFLLTGNFRMTRNEIEFMQQTIGVCGAAPQAGINLLSAALEPCCEACSFAFKPKFWPRVAARIFSASN